MKKPAEVRDFVSPATQKVLVDVAHERLKQIAKFGDQSALPDGTGKRFRIAAKNAKEEYRIAKPLTWAHVLREEHYEALETDWSDEHLREELVQVAAVAVAWIEALDKRKSHG